MTDKRMWVIEMPETWIPGNGELNYFCRTCGRNIVDGKCYFDCPFANAKPAVEISQYEFVGKPVTLYAVEKEERK